MGSKMVDYKKLSHLEILPMLCNFFLKRGEIHNAQVKSNGFAQLLASLLKLLQWHRAIGAYMIVENGGCLVELIKTQIWTQLDGWIDR